MNDIEIMKLKYSNVNDINVQDNYGHDPLNYVIKVGLVEAGPK
jgi:hypothetical protein